MVGLDDVQVSVGAPRRVASQRELKEIGPEISGSCSHELQISEVAFDYDITNYVKAN